MGISIGLKNCLDIIDSVGKYYDFAINERCHERGECYWYKNYLKTGKPVFGIAYGSLESNRSRLCKSLNGLPITMVVKTTGRLHQQQVNFDIKEHCGSNYSSGKVDPPKPKDEPKKTTTTVKKTTTTTVKKTTTTTVKKTTTTTVRRLLLLLLRSIQLSLHLLQPSKLQLIQPNKLHQRLQLTKPQLTKPQLTRLQ